MASPWDDVDNDFPESDGDTLVSAPVQQWDGSVSLTFKAGTGYDAPWLVLKSPDVDGLKKTVWKLSEASRKSLEEDNLLLGFAEAGAQFAGYGSLLKVATPVEQPHNQYANPSTSGFTAPSGAPAGARIQQAGPRIPGWAVGQEIPIGPVTKRPMIPREWTGKSDQKLKRAWMSDVPQGTPRNEADEPVWFNG